MSIEQPYHGKELLRRIAEGDQLAFKQLVQQCNSMVYRFVETHITVKQPELIEEVVYDVFLQLWLTRETLPAILNFENYLFILARNKGFNALKKELGEMARRKHWEGGSVAQGDGEQLALENKALGLIDEAIATLSEQQRKVWVMSRRNARTYVQIATELGISRETVKSYLQAANLSIKKYVVNHLEDFPDAVLVLFLFFLEARHPLL
ncbi:RNA polymerase sigma factor [Filimonas effusa]|uniref:RNA polymerase sigma factor n=1 Tax=Filimonas effusa TaxID=2508721 RepID=UPI0013E930EC|nr:sigma-70 family RNA polymerase sigma factor [Filimonas effusa]